MKERTGMKKGYLIVCLILTFIWNVLHAAQSGWQMYIDWTSLHSYSYMVAKLQREILLCGIDVCVDMAIAVLAVIGISVLVGMKEKRAEDIRD